MPVPRRSARLATAAATLLVLLAPSAACAAQPPPAPSSSSATEASTDCLDRASFEQVASRLAPHIFEGSDVMVRVRDGRVSCASGWAYANVTYVYPDRTVSAEAGRRGWLVLRRVDDEWQWTVDDYWQQFGDSGALCARLPDRLRANVACPSPSAATEASCDSSTLDRRSVTEAAAAGWVGACIPGDFCEIDGMVRLTGPETVTESQGWGEVHIMVGHTVRGDINGDRAEEAAVMLDCNNGGGTAAGQLAFAYVVFDGSDRGLEVLGVVTPRKQEDGVHPTLFQQVTLRPGRVTVRELWYRSSDATCCPSGTATTVWRLSNGSLSPGMPNVTG
ncbi:hypothetical protein AB0H57_10025 [Micromonospora sp. NPDC050686]|uniref:hypothetical protein n=1 Tax=Micromonospora sp. NPDC050686 TaxID=3154631 RepID=UPI00340AFF79